MKILLATTVISLNGGGIASCNYEIRNALNENNVFHALTNESSSLLEGYDKVYSVPELMLSGYESYQRLLSEINRESYDIIINSDSSPITILAPFIKSPILTISHTYNNMPAIEAGYNHKYVSKIVALSSAGETFLQKYFHIKNKSKLCYIYNFVRHKDICVFKQKANCEKLKIVFPGGASLMKYPEMVLGAVNKLIKTNLDFDFYWLGGLTLPLRKFSLPQTINQLAADDSRIHFTGKIPREEALRYIENANIFLLPSRAEGCPMTLVEAMCTGCIPIVGDAKHVCREILEDGQFGVIVKQGSSVDLYNAIIDIIKNHSNYIKNYQLTYEYSKANLSEDIWCKHMYKAIEEAIRVKKEYKVMSKFLFFK